MLASGPGDPAADEDWSKRRSNLRIFLFYQAQDAQSRRIGKTAACGGVSYPHNDQAGTS
ncbi:hypothetical protein U717_07850 [Rhodobacter capsulatus R121]|nr:hypothetical protein U714_07675 [Rhodobacter capsulatus DE442]ETD77861.1 hypothetical protein U717_07850 [Rhodobacter capsulatus R121]ETE54204.1 hypothetical protein U715_07850 [Rhodobacter capsulatus Y262]